MRFLALYLMVLLASCADISTNSENQYFDVKSIVISQQEILNRSNVSLSKYAIIGSDTAKASLKPDSTIWQQELGIFERIDINKPQWKDQYEVSDEEDQFSNLIIRTYTSLNQASEIKYIKIYYLKNILDVRKIESSWEENNPIYKSKRDLTLHFEDINNQVVINGYEVHGVQKMILQDEVAFSITAKIDFTTP